MDKAALQGREDKLSTKKSGGLQKAGDSPLLEDLARPLTIKPTTTKPAGKRPKPDRPEFDNRQLNLFQSFLCNNDEERDRLSNAIDLWDNVPRYSISRQAMTKQRLSERFLEKHTAEFQYKGKRFTRTLSPARVKDLDGVERDYYASATEELVEDALRKLATDQHAGYFDKPNYRSGVVFTLYALRQELQRRGHTRSYQEIILALNILSGSVIEIVSDDGGDFLSRSTYIPHLAAVSRTRLRNDPDAKWLVQFHPLITGSIDNLTYRQYNYHQMMTHSTQLARWLHKQLVLKYTFASLTAPFEIHFTTIKRDSGLLDAYARLRDAIAAVEEAFDELKQRDVLMSCQRTDVTGPRKKLLDAIFKLLPSVNFVAETKAGSKRINLAIQPPKDRR